jgi:hypothetical protein
MFDISEQQFTMLLLMMQPQNQPAICLFRRVAGKQPVQTFIHIRPIFQDGIQPGTRKGST